VKLNIARIKYLVASALVAAFVIGCGADSSKSEESMDTAVEEVKEPKVKLVENAADKKVDVLIDGELFTSYIYPDNIAKPVLYPLTTASGKVLSRSFPLDTIPGERIDHPHHVGHWLNYGDVNGLDFWNNSEAISEDRKHKFGTIKHKSVKSTTNGDSGVLEVTTDWVAPTGEVLLVEETSFKFSVEGGTRIIDRTTKLSAQATEVSFKDNKEGMIAIRVTRAMELPVEKAAVFLDEHGVPTETKVLNNEGVNGDYLSSEGVTGKEVWGTRGRWMNLHSNLGGEDVAILIIDHPSNVGYPTYWHARDYGLFAANPLGQAALSDGKEELNFKLAANSDVTFKYRIAIHSGSKISVDAINKLADDFAK